MGAINVYDKITTENQKKKKTIWYQRTFYINIHRKHRLQMEFTAC